MFISAVRIFTRRAKTFCSPSIRVFSDTVDAKLNLIDPVAIDDGVFKYVLIRVYGEKEDGTEPSKIIVRGYSDAKWHSDVYKRARSIYRDELGLETECLGGGHMEHDPDEEYIKVYGYSDSYGIANHKLAKELLKLRYKEYNIDASDIGY